MRGGHFWILTLTLLLTVYDSRSRVLTLTDPRGGILRSRCLVEVRCGPMEFDAVHAEQRDGCRKWSQIWRRNRFPAIRRARFEIVTVGVTTYLSSVGEYHRHLSGKHSRTQRRCHVVACVLRIHRLLDDKRDLLFSQFRRLHCRLRWLVLPLLLICYNISLLVSIYTFHL